MKYFKFITAFCMLWILVFAGDAYAEGFFLDDVIIEYEAGPLYIFQNDGLYGENGTKYKAKDVGQQRNLILSRRTSLELGFSGRHRIIFLYAPFDITTSVKLDRDITFRDTTFNKGDLVEHRYLFDGYRVSYLYRAVSKPGLDADLGGSIQIRNAEVSFKEEGGNKYDSENDIGTVFAFKGRVRYQPAAIWMMAEADAFSTFGLLGDSVRGAIYDLRLSLGLPVSRVCDLVFSGRLLGGGAKVKSRDIDNWGNYGSLTVSLQMRPGFLFSSP